MSDSSSFLATYGTLRRAFGGLNRLGVLDRVTFVGPCECAGRLCDLGRFPGAVPGDGLVRGDLFRVVDPAVWTVLDRYEGYDPARPDASLFLRRRVHLERPTGRTAWIYWYNGNVEGCPPVSSGDWTEYVNRPISG